MECALHDLLLQLLSYQTFHSLPAPREAMDKCTQKSQIAKLSLIALLLVTPLLSTSMRPPFLYFLLNPLIIALGAEAGLLSFPKPLEEKKLITSLQDVRKVSNDNDVDDCSSKRETKMTEKVEQKKSAEVVKVDRASNYNEVDESSERQTKMVEKPELKKIVEVVKVDNAKMWHLNRVDYVKKSPSKSSLFFIGEDENEEELIEHEEEEELEREELYTKAEMFIGNFYKQLNMQKEESWKRIHGFYQKAFRLQRGLHCTFHVSAG